MRLSCLMVSSLLDRRTADLDEASRLIVEEHLAGCDQCAADTALVASLRHVLSERSGELTARRRQRIVKRALRAAPRSTTPNEPLRWRLPLGAIAAAVVLASYALVWWPASTAHEQRSGLRAARGLAPVTPIEVPERVEETAVDDVRLVSGQAQLNGASLAANENARLLIGAATIDVIQAAALQWDNASSKLSLRSGSIRVSLAPGGERPFRVVTATFVVEVVGTEFEVDQERVVVSRGHVNVLAELGGKVLAELGPQQRWSRAAGAPAPSSTPTPTSATRADELIAVARHTLAQRNVPKARRLLQRVLGMKLDVRQRAEARSLLAECALLEGDNTAAAKAYGDVAEQNAGTLAGETALFGKAQAELRAGKNNAARQTFHRYLRQYPAGRFHREARAQLGRLRGK